MLRRAAVALAFAVAVPGCFLLSNQTYYSESKPPQDAVAADKWWKETLAQTDGYTLRCWHHASEYHRAHGSSATYVSEVSEVSFRQPIGLMIGASAFTTHRDEYPTPIPANFVPIVTARLAAEDVKVQRPSDPPDPRWVPQVERLENCTKEEALAAWKN